eukprot:XP_001706025.1 Hypothetical protein GL50803_39212 [Giardia lamblia ATCC 50803]
MPPMDSYFQSPSRQRLMPPGAPLKLASYLIALRLVCQLLPEQVLHASHRRPRLAVSRSFTS